MAENATFQIPEGFKLESETTKVGDVEYALQYPVATSLDAWRAYWESRGLNFEDTALKYINEIQTQRATQGGKGKVRDAAADPEKGITLEQAQADAISKHQAQAAKFLLGKPRERAAGGVTKKATADFGARVLQAMSAKGGMLNQAELAEIAKEMGIDPALLA